MLYFFVLSFTFMCIYPSKYHYIHCVYTVLLQSAPQHWGICQPKGLYYPGLFLLSCPLVLYCVVSLYTQNMHASRKRACVHRPKPICGKILLIPIVQPFPTIFSHPPCPLPLSLYPDLIRLQGMQAEWKHGDKYTAEI